MKYLLDTNAWIGFFQGSGDFGKRAKSVMLDESWECCVSIAGVWEAAIKVGLGKLKLPYDLVDDLPRILEENGFGILPVELGDATGVLELKPVHGDPFDRIQVVQASRRGLGIISRDEIFDRYGVRRIW